MEAGPTWAIRSRRRRQYAEIIEIPAWPTSRATYAPNEPVDARLLSLIFGRENRRSVHQFVRGQHQPLPRCGARVAGTGQRASYQKRVCLYRHKPKWCHQLTEEGYTTASRLNRRTLSCRAARCAWVAETRVDRIRLSSRHRPALPNRLGGSANVWPQPGSAFSNFDSGSPTVEKSTWKLHNRIDTMAAGQYCHT